MASAEDEDVVFELDPNQFPQLSQSSKSNARCSSSNATMIWTQRDPIELLQCNNSNSNIPEREPELDTTTVDETMRLEVLEKPSNGGQSYDAQQPGGRKPNRQRRRRIWNEKIAQQMDLLLSEQPQQNVHISRYAGNNDDGGGDDVGTGYNRQQRYDDNTEQAMRVAIRANRWDSDCMSATDDRLLDLCVELDRPKLFKKILLLRMRRKQQLPQQLAFRALHRPACWDVLLSIPEGSAHWTTALDEHGNNILHETCRCMAGCPVLFPGQSSSSLGDLARGQRVLEQLLQHPRLPIVAHYRHQKQQQLLQLAVNKNLENPLHVASRVQSQDAVTSLLTSVPVSTALTMLSQRNRCNEDSGRNSAWSLLCEGGQDPMHVAVQHSRAALRGILQFLGRFQCRRPSAPTSPCPLLQAIGNRDTAPARLLIQHAEFVGCDLDRALFEAAKLQGCDDIVDTLQENGATPFSTHTITFEISDSITTLELAVSQRDFQLLRRLQGNCSNQALSEEGRDAVVDALLAAVTAYRGGSNSGQQLDELGIQYLGCAEVLLEWLEYLDVTILERLKCCLRQTNHGVNRLGNNAADSLLYTYQTTLSYPVCDDHHPSYWSGMLAGMPWMQHGNMPCEKSTVHSILVDRGLASREGADIIIVTEEGIELVAHSSIVSSRSLKLAAAIRFAQMAGGEDGNLCLPVNIPHDLCILLLYHIYHGSLTGGLPRERDQLFDVLASLLLLGGEFLCLTLVQECELRLLSSDPWQCHCWACLGDWAIEKNNVQHTVMVQSPTVPVAPQAAYNIFAACQASGESLMLAEGYSIIRTPKCWFPSAATQENSSYPPTGALREVVATVMISNFKETLRASDVDSGAPLLRVILTEMTR